MRGRYYEDKGEGKELKVKTERERSRKTKRLRSVLSVLQPDTYNSVHSQAASSLNCSTPVALVKPH